ncbi:MAG: hypothetical protein EPO32_12165 [Anaerolineae bacterium]|nr:MAG: hypothetical protein EPO32_12165 [Anaerolineae bacterium]
MIAPDIPSVAWWLFMVSGPLVMAYLFWLHPKYFEDLALKEIEKVPDWHPLIMFYKWFARPRVLIWFGRIAPILVILIITIGFIREMN